MKRCRDFLISFIYLSPYKRKLLLISLDLLFTPIYILTALFVVSHATTISNISYQWMLWISVPITFLVYYFTGQYRGLTKYVGSYSSYKQMFRNILSIGIIYLIGLMVKSYSNPPFKLIFLIFIFTSFFSITLKFVLRDLLLQFTRLKKKKSVRIAIYGAGEAGAQLISSLNLTSKYKIITILDDCPDLWGRTLRGYVIQSPESLHTLINHIDQVLLAIPSLDSKRRSEILSFLEAKKIKVMQIPSIEDLASGVCSIASLKPIEINDLLGRDPISPKPSMLRKVVEGKCICITGAGGSIGSELCRQIIQHDPKKIILIENSEIALYSINQELENYQLKGIEIVPILADVCDEEYLTYLLLEANVNIVFHAAAYKHVPLLESNRLNGLYNNIYSTYSVCKAALKAKSNNVVLISSDKAVRPTNIMGASKRLSEIVIQSFSDKSTSLISGKGDKTKFSMVRFGNVLGSSGSVIPLFIKQIESGGPVTITHPEITRYFMTITEAAQLVIQSTALTKGGDVFLLDMGEKVNIKEMAQKMISLYGLTIKDSFNKEGDIEIIYTGMRPGEKLYEELLIDAKAEKTLHPLIYRAVEDEIPSEEFIKQLEFLKVAIKNREINTVEEILFKLVKGLKIKRSNNF